MVCQYVCEEIARHEPVKGLPSAIRDSCVTNRHYTTAFTCQRHSSVCTRCDELPVMRYIATRQSFSRNASSHPTNRITDSAYETGSPGAGDFGGAAGVAPYATSVSLRGSGH